MDILMLRNLAILICASIGVLLGFRYLQSRKNLYASMIVLGVACIGLGRLYQCARLWTGGSLISVFQPGILGTMGAFSFFFSANFGQIDSLVDDGGKSVRKYRLFGLIGPIYVVAMLIPILVSPARIGFKVGCAFTFAEMVFACYFHVKHLLIPDVDGGVVKCLRGYNALAVILSVFCMGELIGLAYGWEIVVSTVDAGIGIVSLLVVSVMKRGVKAWTK